MTVFPHIFPCWNRGAGSLVYLEPLVIPVKPQLVSTQNILMPGYVSAEKGKKWNKKATQEFNELDKSGDNPRLSASA